jgi:hypothetical protein
MACAAAAAFLVPSAVEPGLLCSCRRTKTGKRLPGVGPLLTYLRFCPLPHNLQTEGTGGGKP